MVNIQDQDLVEFKSIFLQSLILLTQARHPTALIVAYLDDTYDVDEVEEALACLLTGAATAAQPAPDGCGVPSNETKRCIFSPERRG